MRLGSWEWVETDHPTPLCELKEKENPTKLLRILMHVMDGPEIDWFSQKNQAPGR